jgi:glycosyltransferase involved in cell wall biosynthesis
VRSPTISLIVSTYNRPDFLRLVLDGIANQGDDRFELIISDDGSGPETKRCIDGFSSTHAIDLKHIWHEDEGFRKTIVLNKSIAAASNEYLVFIDGDCIPRSNFIAQHRSLARKNRIVGCDRVRLDEKTTQRLLDNDLEIHGWSLLALLKLRMGGHINRLLPLISLPLGAFRNRTPHRWQRIRGCNFGIFKEDICAIHGFDESFTGWGYEDSDLAARAINQGCLVRRGDHAATVLHLWHEELNRDEAKSNRHRLEASISRRPAAG